MIDMSDLKRPISVRRRFELQLPIERLLRISSSRALSFQGLLKPRTGKHGDVECLVAGRHDSPPLASYLQRNPRGILRFLLERLEIRRDELAHGSSGFF